MNRAKIGDMKGRLKAVGFCAIGIVLGSLYIALAFQDFDISAGILLAFLVVPAFYFVRAGGTDGPLRYEKNWDDTLVIISLIAIGAEVAMLIVRAILAQIYLGWLPDVAICLLAAAMCFRRAYLWSKVARSVPLD